MCDKVSPPFHRWYDMNSIFNVQIISALAMRKTSKSGDAWKTKAPTIPLSAFEIQLDATRPVGFVLKIKEGIFVVCHWHIHERSQNRLGKLSLLCIQVPARFNIEWMIQNGFLIPGKWGEMSVTTKNREGKKKIHNPLKLKSCSRVQNILFPPLALSLSLLRVVFM